MADIIDHNIEDIYPPSLITDVEEFKQYVLANHKLNDMQKLKYIFDVSKEELKKSNPQLYYAILAVLHSAKCMKCAGMMTAPSDYFSTAHESKEDK